MDLNRFKEFYQRVGFWKFWCGVLVLVLLAYALILVFLNYVGPYIVGLWLAGMLG